MFLSAGMGWGRCITGRVSGMERKPCASVPEGAEGPDCALAVEKSNVSGSREHTIPFMDLVLVSSDARGAKIHRKKAIFISGILLRACLVMKKALLNLILTVAAGCHSPIKNTGVLLLGLLLVFKGQAQAPAGDSLVNAAGLLRIEQKLLDGIATGDTALWKQYLAPGYMIVNEDGSRSDRATYLHDLKPLPQNVSGHINIVNPHFNFTGNIAVLNYVADEYEQYFGQSLHTSYAMMSVYQKDKHGWQMLNTQIFEIPQLPASISLADDVLQQYTGVYYLVPDITYTVSLEDHRLYGQRKGRDKELLLPETVNVFFRKSDTRGRKLFVRGSNGAWEMHERRNGQDIVWKNLSRS